MIHTLVSFQIVVRFRCIFTLSAGKPEVSVIDLRNLLLFVFVLLVYVYKDGAGVHIVADITFKRYAVMILRFMAAQSFQRTAFVAANCTLVVEYSVNVLNVTLYTRLHHTRVFALITLEGCVTVLVLKNMRLRSLKKFLFNLLYFICPPPRHGLI